MNKLESKHKELMEEFRKRFNLDLDETNANNCIQPDVEDFLDSALSQIAEVAKEETIDSLNKSVMGIAVGVALVAGAPVAEAMITAWNSATNKLQVGK